MTIIELYINNRLCDVGRDFGIRLNRQLLNPGELNTKDAQYSYSITLPPTSNNHAIFNYSNIEETKDKFNHEYKAELIINSVRVFKGLFRMSAITINSYKGNLYIPAAKSVKDIYGDTQLSDSGTLTVSFTEFAQSVSEYNNRAKNGEITPVIFPYALYGLLPKVPGPDGDYTARDLWDDTVRMGITDLPASVNVLEALKAIFESKGYALSGSAFDDERLTRLYLSYKNPEDYTQPWNWGRMAHIKLHGDWTNYVDDNTMEWSSLTSIDEFDKTLYNTDLFNAYRSTVVKDIDPGNNVLTRTITEREDIKKITTLTIPVSGVYKIHFHASMHIDNVRRARPDPQTGEFIYVSGEEATMSNKRYEIKLLRDRKKGDFNIGSGVIDGVFYKNNLYQSPESPLEESPKYFPDIVNNRQINFIDKAQNDKLLTGFTFGRIADKPETLNPKEGGIDRNIGQILVAKPAMSWDSSYSEELDKVAIDSPGYYKRYIDDQGNPKNGKPDSPKYKIEVTDQPDIFALRGQFDGDYNNRVNWDAEGSVSILAYLEAGEMLTIAHTNTQNRGVDLRTYYGQPGVEIKWDLEIIPYKESKEFITVNSSGNSTEVINWKGDSDFSESEIDLIKFLPSDMKVDDFVDNFCKAFNLRLSQTDDTRFSLDVKQTRQSFNNQYINLDNLTAVRDRSNTPLGIPSLYRLGFTIDKEEEGYLESKDDGGGEYPTGAIEEKIIEQKSSFSYNWFKDITKVEASGNIALRLPVISKSDVWSEYASYLSSMTKRYTNQALRFWYFDGLLNDQGATFLFQGNTISIAKVSNELPGLNILNYKNQKLTILDNYFTLLINSSSHYTEVEGYLTPDQYEDFNGEIMAMFNGDLYYVAEMSGYDPTGRNKTKLKLIRKI